MNGYREFRFFSAELDSQAARLSMTDGRGREYFAIVPAARGKAWRLRKEAALDALDEAIARGGEPGEVRVNADAARQL